MLRKEESKVSWNKEIEMSVSAGNMLESRNPRRNESRWVGALNIIKKNDEDVLNHEEMSEAKSAPYCVELEIS
jgi:hypothetical protein